MRDEINLYLDSTDACDSLDTAPGGYPAIVIEEPTAPAGDGRDACRDIIAQEDTALAALGVGEAEELFYAKGTTTDLARLAQYKAEYDALPDAQPAVAAYSATVAAERRADVPRDLGSMRLTVSGHYADKSMIANPDAGLTLTDTAWRQLESTLGSRNLNAAAAGLKRSVTRTVRTRRLPESSRPEAYGVVSSNPKSGYVVFDGPEALHHAARGLADAGVACKARIDYDQATTAYQADFLVNAPIDIPAFQGVGKVHQLFLRIWGGDDGATSVQGKVGAIRIRCMNASLTQSHGAEWRKVHRGQASEIAQLVRGSVAQFGKVVESLREVWARAAANHFMSEEGGSMSAPEALAQLVRGGTLPLGGCTEEQAIDAYTAAWRAEDSPHSAMGVIMAAQRAAHEGPWSTKWAATEIEEAASALLYQKVYTLEGAS